MANNLRVTLNESTNPWTVDIDQTGNAHHVARSEALQSVDWHLNGNAATGSIVSLTWAGTPPRSGIFGAPTFSPARNSMAMADLNNSSNTTGEWFYILTVAVGGNTYQSNPIATTGVGTATNPSIKNN
ncbi:hypothetical protein [Dyella amyloliquefaciens]|uniref:hypothetical protein n=1 Tax=Dyella amyloliquefaciens TaxID=1770545 RepID=UPI00102E3DD5|nr:hypothetical protein [Dyella amyloliquefaciens]